MYVAFDTDEEEGSHEGEAEIPCEGLNDLESIDLQGDEGSGCIAGVRGHLEEHCSEEEALSGTTYSGQVILVIRGRDQAGPKTRFRLPPLKCGGTMAKEKKRFRFHQVNFVRNNYKLI